MKTFLIIVAVLAVIIIAILSLSATVTLVYDKGWHTTVQILFIKKDIVLSKILSFILFPEKKAEEVAKESEDKKKNKKGKKGKDNETPAEKVADVAVEAEEKSLETDESEKTEEVEDKKGQQPPKPNPIKKLWDTQGIVGMLDLFTNVAETANNAVLTLFRGLHIYSLYVMILVGGGDADLIARAYGTLCRYYYPLKGMILNGMKVDNYDDYIQPDFIAERTEFEFQLIASINVKLILKVGFKAVFIFIKNLIINKKSIKGDK
ncbi:MAG: hypothetical protein PUF01_00865 [Eubacteriales bacterium]|nr:hypothetical protein [Eubacteriales bacterium]